MTSNKDTDERSVAPDDQTERTGKDTGDDTEGHSMFMDPETALRLARTRSAELQREARNNQRAKEARPNRDKR